MFETPTITEIGKAEDLILGIAATGWDLDGSWVASGFEFLDDDVEEASRPAGE
jgi:hypothetical protein